MLNVISVLCACAVLIFSLGKAFEHLSQGDGAMATAYLVLAGIMMMRIEGGIGGDGR